MPKYHWWDAEEILVACPRVPRKRFQDNGTRHDPPPGDMVDAGSAIEAGRARSSTAAASPDALVRSRDHLRRGPFTTLLFEFRASGLQGTDAEPG